MQVADNSHDQKQAAFRRYGGAVIPITMNAAAKAVSQMQEDYAGDWCFHLAGELLYWAPDSEERFTVDCPGAMSTVQDVDSKTLGIAFTIMAINHLSFDAHQGGNEVLADSLAEWHESLTQFAYESGEFNTAAICTILD